MTRAIEVRICVESDFHVGTGAGIGRTVDSVVLKDEHGFPYVPGSQIKGLARWHAEEIVALLQGQAAGKVIGNDLVEEIFGRPGDGTGGAVGFGNARCDSAGQARVHRPRVHGRSGRDRKLRRAAEEKLFHYEDAAAGDFVAHLTPLRDLSPAGLLLLILSLRRIEAVGGQRSRGKGRACVKLRIDGGPFDGLELPGEHDALRGAFERVSAGESPLEDSPSADRSLPRAGGPVGARSTLTHDVLLVFAVAVEPLTLTGTPQLTNEISSLGYVPGASVRGAFAHFLLSQGWKPEDSRFTDIFVREHICFGPLYPCLPLPWSPTASMPFPAPRTVLTCKHAPGVRDGYRLRADVHGVRDVLQANPLDLCGESNCKAPLEPCGGFLQFQKEEDREEWRLRRVDISPASIQRTEIDESTSRGKDGVLYATEVIPRGTWLAGHLWGPRDRLTELRDTCSAASGPLRLRIGKSRTRGHGALDLYLRQPDSGAHASFPGLLRKDHAVADDDLTLTLHSDTIGIDQLLRPIARLDGALLWQLLEGKDSSPLEVVRGHAGVRKIDGFNGQPGLPRTPDLALAAGSTWLVRVRGSASDADRRQARELLANAMTRGVGLRRGEGFGRVVVDQPLHAAGVDQPGKPGFLLTAGAGSVRPGTFPTAIDHRPRWTPPPPAITAATVNLGAGFVRLLLQLAEADDPVASIDEIRRARETRSKDPRNADSELGRIRKLLADLEPGRQKFELRKRAAELARAASRRVASQHPTGPTSDTSDGGDSR